MPPPAQIQGIMVVSDPWSLKKALFLRGKRGIWWWKNPWIPLNNQHFGDVDNAQAYQEGPEELKISHEPYTNSWLRGPRFEEIGDFCHNTNGNHNPHPKKAGFAMHVPCRVSFFCLRGFKIGFGDV